MCDRLTSNDKQNYKNSATVAAATAVRLVSSVESVSVIVCLFLFLILCSSSYNRNPITNLSVCLFNCNKPLNSTEHLRTHPYTQTNSIVNGTPYKIYALQCTFFFFVKWMKSYKTKEQKTSFFSLLLCNCFMCARVLQINSCFFSTPRASQR